MRDKTVLATINGYEVKESAVVSYSYKFKSDEPRPVTELQLNTLRSIIYCFKVSVCLPIERKAMCDLLADLHVMILEEKLPFRNKAEKGKSIITNDGVMVWLRMTSKDELLDEMIGDKTIPSYSKYMPSNKDINEPKNFELDCRRSFKQHSDYTALQCAAIKFVNSYRVTFTFEKDMNSNMTRLAQMSQSIKNGAVEAREATGFALFRDSKVGYINKNVTEEKSVSVIDDVNNSKKLLDDLLSGTVECNTHIAKEVFEKEVFEATEEEVAVTTTQETPVCILEPTTNGNEKTYSIILPDNTKVERVFARTASPIKCLGTIIESYKAFPIAIDSKYKKKKEELETLTGATIQILTPEDLIRCKGLE